MKRPVYYILAKGIYVGIYFCMHEQSMNHNFLEKREVCKVIHCAGNVLRFAGRLSAGTRVK